MICEASLVYNSELQDSQGHVEALPPKTKKRASVQVVEGSSSIGPPFLSASWPQALSSKGSVYIS